MHNAKLLFSFLFAGLLSVGGQALAQGQVAQETNPGLYPQPEPYPLRIHDPHVPAPGALQGQVNPYQGGCRPVPTYEMTALGLQSAPTRCADRPGEGILEALHPGSLIEPMMIIEVGSGTTIIIPRRQYFPGMGRVIRVY